jgi:hypothetical protein
MVELAAKLSGKVVEWILGQSIESVGALRSHPLVRLACVVLVLVISLWIAVASTFLWTSQHYPDVQGLWQFVQRGGPAWVLATPTCAVMAVLWLLFPYPGKFSPVMFFTAGAFGFGLASLAYFQGGGQYAVNAAAVFTMVPSTLLPILGLMLALSDMPPLDSPLARVAVTYLGRLRHLRALRAWARQRGWEIHGPNGSENTLVLKGAYDRWHPVTAVSGGVFRLSTSNSTTYFLMVRMGSRCDIVPFGIGAFPPPKEVHGQLRNRGLTGSFRPARWRRIHYWVEPDEGRQVPDEFMDRFGALLGRGAALLHNVDFACAAGNGIMYRHQSNIWLRVHQANLDPLLQWMAELTTLLEQISPRPALAPSSSHESPPPYMQE